MSTPALKTATKAQHAPWMGLFENLTREHGFEPMRVEGTLPPDLVGTLYRNGPSHFESFGYRYQHLFDGDGGVSAVRLLGDGKALGAAKLVQSEGLLEERRAGRRLYGAYGSPKPRFQRGSKAVKNSANTSVMVWQDRLYAMLEAAKPVELSTEDLGTLGERDLDGVVVHSFSAHPHRVPSRKASYNFGVRYGRHTEIDLYELPDAGSARRMGMVRLSGATMIHDFIATERHLIFFAPPLRLKLFKMVLGLGSYGDNLEWKPELGTEVLVIPIDAPDQVIRFTTDAFYQWHFANAFEREGTVVVDLVEYPDFASNLQFKALVHGERIDLRMKLTRAELDLVGKSMRRQPILEQACEFPRVSTSHVGREHHTVFVADHPGADSYGWFSSVSAVNVNTGGLRRFQFEANQYVSEPVFVRKPEAASANAGYLLPLVYDAGTRTSHLAVIDAERIEAGPIARAHFDHAIPVTFHGNFARSPTGRS